MGEIFEDKNARYIEDHGISRHGISRNYCNKIKLNEKIIEKIILNNITDNITFTYIL